MRSMVLVIAAVAGLVSGSAVAPERTVSGHTVNSIRDPRVAIQLPDQAQYVGADTFLLGKPKLGNFDVCELYVFANSSESGSLREVYWVQFEHLLPKHPKLHYTYDSPRHATIGGIDFFVDIEVSDGTAKPKPNSDGDHFYQLLAAHGYKRTPMMFVRLVHLTDATKRKELMIVAGKQLPAGLTAESVKKGGSAYSRWPAIQEDLIAWAVHSIVIEPRG